MSVALSVKLSIGRELYVNDFAQHFAREQAIELLDIVRVEHIMALQAARADDAV